MKNIKLPLDMKERIIATIPAALIKERDGGGKTGKLSYISGQTVTDLLNAIFGYAWDWEAEKEWIQESSPYFNQYAKQGPDVEMTTINGKIGAWEGVLPVAHVKGRLTVRYIDGEGNDHTITKTGYGSKSIIGKQSEQESVFKAAGTDALKKAASLLGIGLELYRDEEEQAYFDEMNYEDPWTEEAKTQFATERNYLIKFMSDYDLDEEGMASMVMGFSEETLGSIYDIIPDNIAAFTEYLKEQVAVVEKDAAETAAKAEASKPAKKEKE